MTNARTTQAPVEALSTVSPNARTTQLPVETLSQVSPRARVTQLPVEVLSSSALAANRRPPVIVFM